MATLRWYFDFVSPYSYLHWQKLKRLPQFGQIQPVPIAFGAVLHHLGNLGPAEIPAKRRFMYRQLQWTAQAEGTPLALWQKLLCGVGAGGLGGDGGAGGGPGGAGPLSG